MGNKKLLAAINELSDRTERMEKRLDELAHLLENQDHREALSPSKEFFTPTEVAEMLGKSSYTVREWCRFGRIEARKRPIGRGDALEWEITASEIERFKNHGLLPRPKLP
ncbi:MAG: helix-turn-helix domain-containing protein [Planctomycetaceae bacterium]